MTSARRQVQSCTLAQPPTHARTHALKVYFWWDCWKSNPIICCSQVQNSFIYFTVRRQKDQAVKMYICSDMWGPQTPRDDTYFQKGLVHAVFLSPGWAGDLTRPEEDVWPGVSAAAEGHRVEGLRDPEDHPGTGPGNLHHRMQCEHDSYALMGLFWLWLTCSKTTLSIVQSNWTALPPKWA